MAYPGSSAVKTPNLSGTPLWSLGRVEKFREAMFQSPVSFEPCVNGRAFIFFLFFFFFSLSPFLLFFLPSPLFFSFPSPYISFSYYSLYFSYPIYLIFNFILTFIYYSPPEGLLRVRSSEAEDGDVLVGITLHEIDEQRPQRRVLDVAELFLQLLQLP